jgi:hypothetical protein
MKIALGLIAAMAVAVGVFWMGWVSAPSPDAICDHKIELVRAEAEGRNAEPLIERLRETCVDNAERRVQYRGRVKYAVYAKCVMAADSLETAERCSSVNKR